MKKSLSTIVVLAIFLSACGVSATPTAAPTEQPTSTIAASSTPASVPTSSPTGTPAPVSTFPAPYIDMSSPALAPVDVRLNVKNDSVNAIFYLQDVPSELTFDQADGLVEGGIETMWKVCVDADNDTTTGASMGWLAGADYCLWAAHFKSGDVSKAIPIEQAVQVSISQLSGESETKISDGTIAVDPDGDTITLSGTIPGITGSSQLFYEIYDGDSGADISSPLYDRIFVEQ